MNTPHVVLGTHTDPFTATVFPSLEAATTYIEGSPFKNCLSILEAEMGSETGALSNPGISFSEAFMKALTHGDMIMRGDYKYRYHSDTSTWYRSAATSTAYEEEYELTEEDRTRTDWRIYSE